jgi:hypothetical protein
VRWVRHIRDNCDAPPDVRAFLLVLATYADADGLCWPSLETVAGNLGIHPDSAKRRRNRAVELGWLKIKSPGRWKGTSTRYLLQPKVGVGAPLGTVERGASVPAKGVHGRRSKGGVDAPRTIKKFQEGDDGAPSMEKAPSLRERRRALGRAIREAKSPDHKRRFMERFDRDYGHLYGRPVAA